MTAATTKTRVQANVNTQAEISRGAIISLASAGAVVGIWAFASLATAMVMTGGPIALTKAWFGAVMGI
ncbi:MAG TPA: hypothetical protein ENI89_03205 [Desulfobulbus sp.]|nr:hypothetical protein [Desulfobulbus sp.]